MCLGGFTQREGVRYLISGHKCSGGGEIPRRGTSYKTRKKGEGEKPGKLMCPGGFFFFIMYSRKVQVKYIADARLQGRNQEKHMVIRR
jgi:hypothetical protein